MQNMGGVKMYKIVLNASNRLAKQKCNQEFAEYLFNLFKHLVYKASLVEFV